MTNDFTKIFMTSINDIDYYLPKFGFLKENYLEKTDSMIIPITKTTDLCLGLKDIKKKNINNNNIKDPNNEKENSKSKSKLEVSGNSITSFDS